MPVTENTPSAHDVLVFHVFTYDLAGNGTHECCFCVTVGRPYLILIPWVHCSMHSTQRQTPSVMCF
eukprot:m.389438 g.389438  ORF g.389438 m.389438 type:complete len:66 (-) comp21050_c0_seq8:1680-1877(-)